MHHEIESISAAIAEHVAVASSLSGMAEDIAEMASIIRTAFANGRRVYLCGNGGSAADAQHIAAELVGRFKHERRGLPAMAFTTDTSILTSVANDYAYDHVFSRQVEALVSKGDVLIGISTSGNSRNILEAIRAGRRVGAATIGMTGGDGGELGRLCGHAIIVPSFSTARIQESHILVGHILCELIDVWALNAG